MLSLVVDIIRVQDRVCDPGHEAVHHAAVLVRAGDVVERLGNVEKDGVDAGQDYRGLGGEQGGQRQGQQFPPAKQPSEQIYLALILTGRQPELRSRSRI